MLGIVFIGLGTLVWAAWMVRAGLVAAQIYQIEEYEAPRLLAWGAQRAWRWSRPVMAGILAALFCGIVATFLPLEPRVVVLGAALLVGSLVLNLLWRRVPAKKPIVYTPRMRRILGAGAGVLLVIALGAAYLILVSPPLWYGMLAAFLILLAPRLALLLPIVGNGLMAPVERNIQQGFVRQARERIAKYRPQVVGIAGSYGKTSTKHIAAQLLGSQIETLPTPKSFNTLMGITRTINENLEQKHKLFLVEMDAYAVGEIQAMCELVQPEAAIITAVGPQHLERFGTVAKIGEAIYELVVALPTNGLAFIYAGEAETAKLAERALGEGRRVVRYGMADEGVALDLLAEEVVIEGEATRFVLNWPQEQLRLPVSIPLLGRHNVLNVLAAIGLAHGLGFSAERAARGAARLEFVPHRLQVLPRTGGMTVIDDSYNANPVGVHNGLEVLAQFQGNAKILVTPGLVELGSLQESENRRYGEHAAKVCDHVILVGKTQTIPIQEGLKAGGLAPERLHVVQSLDEVTALLGQIGKAGDVVLFANDLPDNYLEL
jgi:UDP-N-acetylmuramoyl-tripeptide--D-alanyl-D-alanine ligase